MTHIAKAASKQRKLVFVVVAIVVLVLAAFSIYTTKRSSRIAAGKDALFKARQLLETELAAVSSAMKPPAPVAVKADPKKPAAPETPFSIDAVRFDVTAKLPKSIPAFEAVAKEYDGTPPGYDAKIEVAHLYYDHGMKSEDFAISAKWFESASANAPETSATVAALHGLGYAEEAAGNCDGAVKTFDRALNYGNTLQQLDLLKAQARCYETLKNTASAKTAYGKIASMFPNTDSARYAQNKLTALK